MSSPQNEIQVSLALTPIPSLSLTSYSFVYALNGNPNTKYDVYLNGNKYSTITTDSQGNAGVTITSGSPSGSPSFPVSVFAVPSVS